MGLSFGHLVVVVAVVLVLWYGVKYTQRIEAVRRAVRREMGARRHDAPHRRPTAAAAEDLVKCERCGAYVAAGSSAPCGRADCPSGR